MNTYLFISQTFIDIVAAQQYIAQEYFNSGKLQPAEHIFGGEFNQVDLHHTWNVYQSQNRIIAMDYDSKDDFRQTLNDLYLHYDSPTLLFLNDLSQYSLPLQEGMLKLLEEPPHNLHIILFSQEINQVLPTITSRSCVQIIPKTWIMHHLDSQLLTRVQKNLPEVKTTIQQLIKGQFTAPDLKKVEREELAFWLWQIQTYAEEYYKQNPNTVFEKIVLTCLEARKSNQQNLQKKFVLDSFLYQF